MSTTKVVKLGGGQGFYGDGLAPIADLLGSGIDYLVCDALAELTLAILAKDRMADESLGFARNLGAYIEACASRLADGTVKLITNAGGISPMNATRSALATFKSLGLKGIRVATVLGDDLMPHSDLLPDGGGEAIFANAYIGAKPVAQALEQGANVVITGRVADASLFVAPLAHEFGWDFEDWDLLAQGVTVGHLLECSGQVTGGNYSGRWWENANPTKIGFPIAEVHSTGEAVITKPEGSGGFVTFDTVREQLLYEVHDPTAYLNPDVTVNLAAVDLCDLGNDRVRVSGVLGSPRPPQYKALACHPAGWAGEVRIGYPWPDARAKAAAAARFIRSRCKEEGYEIEEWLEEYFGDGAYSETLIDPKLAGCEPSEVVLRLAWKSRDKSEAMKVYGEVGVLTLSGPPSFAPVGRGRDNKVTQLMKVTPFQVDRSVVDSQTRVVIEDS